jgi:hypothetical protein
LLGLPAEEMVALYRKERGEPTTPIKIVPAAVPPRTRSCLVPSFFVTFFTVLLLLAAVYVVLNFTGMLTPRQTAQGSIPTVVVPTPTTFPTPTDPPADATQSPLPPTPSPPQPTIDPLAPIAAAETPGPAQSATSAAPVVVQAFVADDATSQGSWFTVNADGVPAFNALLRPGQNQTWSGQNEVFLNIGDISVVQLLLNGQNVEGFPGAVRGVPRRLTCTPQGCR